MEKKLTDLSLNEIQLLNSFVQINFKYNKIKYEDI